jgi:hypothetical protein
MIYVEYLRARTALAWHAGALGVLLLLILSTNHRTAVMVDGHPAVTAGLPIALSWLVPIAVFFGAIYASSVGASLNRENATRDISWTKPIPRMALAAQFVLVDLAGVAIAFTLAMLAAIAVVARIGAVPLFDPPFVPQLVLGLGVAAMWYALIQVLTFWLGSGARVAGGILWPVALIALGIAHVPGPYGALARALDVINPFAYVSGFAVTASGSGHAESMLGSLPVEERALIVWFFTAVFCGIAVTLWPRKEA